MKNTNNIQKRILHVVSCMDRAGQETLIMNLYRNIDRSRFQFDFLCTVEKKGEYDDEIRSLGGKIHYLPESSIKIPHLHNIGTILNYKSFFNCHPEYQTVHFHNYHAYSVLIQVIGSKLGKVKNIIVHSHNNNAPNPRIHNIAKPLLKPFKITRLACSVSAGKWMYGDSSFEVLKNGIESEKYIYSSEQRSDIRKELKITENEKLICHIGRFNYQKNHKFLLNVFKELLSIDDNYKLLLIGKGELENEIKDLSKSLGLSEKVIFAGSRSDIPKILSASDVLFFPSIFEGLGIVMIEAQANSLPIVCSDVIPSEAILCNDVKRLSLKNNSLKDWANAVINEANSDRKLNGLALVRHSGFDILNSAKKIMSIYLNV